MEQCELIVTGKKGLVKNILWDVGHTVFIQLQFRNVQSFNLQFICVSRG